MFFQEGLATNRTQLLPEGAELGSRGRAANCKQKKGPKQSTVIFNIKNKNEVEVETQEQQEQPGAFTEEEEETRCDDVRISSSATIKWSCSIALHLLQLSLNVNSENRQYLPRYPAKIKSQISRTKTS